MCGYSSQLCGHAVGVQLKEAAGNIICHRVFSNCLYSSVGAAYGRDVCVCD